jgi:aconitase B
VFRRRWQEVFRFLYKGGFTPETLAERLEIPLIRLQRFIDADYQDDNRLAMRIAQLRWVMIQGEAKDDDGQS